MKQKIFEGFDFTDFWDDSDYSKENYIEEYPSDELIKSIESELGYKLPESYIELMRLHNGGQIYKSCHPMEESTSWAADHIAIEGILGIGQKKLNSIGGELGSKFMCDEWGYPNTGVYICDCPSAGHDMVMLDYTKCGKDGEPEVVHVDQENDYKKTLVAKDFETFIKGLVSDEVFDNSEEELKETLETFKTGRFSDILEEYFKKETNIDFDRVLRNLFTELTKEKGYFALHADELSYFTYDIQFYLMTLNKQIKSKAEFIKDYPSLVAMGNNEISTGGYADFFGDWFDARVKKGDIKKRLFKSSYVFSDKFKASLLEKIKKYE
ncbi:MAG TPA: SMI1/KNR4 family protein [Cytophagales bacterium]|nr:SMI1/KNR4 family protein [Cytophagales bacterium]